MAPRLRYVPLSASALLLCVRTCWDSFLLLPVFGFSASTHLSQVWGHNPFKYEALLPPAPAWRSSHQSSLLSSAVLPSPPGRRLEHGGECDNKSPCLAGWHPILSCSGKGEPAGLVHKPQRVKATRLEKEVSRSVSYSSRHMLQAWHRSLCSPSGNELPPMEGWTLENSSYFLELLQSTSWRCPDKDPQGIPPSHRFPLEGLLQHRLLDPTPEFPVCLTSSRWCRGWWSRDHTQNHCSTADALGRR